MVRYWFVALLVTTLGVYFVFVRCDMLRLLQKQAKVASRFSICQLGICLFFQTPGNPDTLECDAYNIDTFDARRDLSASPGALSFLAANGFDFNEW